MTRVAAAVAVAVMTGALLAGCVSAPPAPPKATTSAPTGETVAAELEPFYSQVLAWSPCEETFLCATATAPLDWTDPVRSTISLALIRATAPGDAVGSLLVNPGGPGASGYDFVRDSLDFAVTARVQQRYDIVGFDPRGVGRSSAVDCYDDPKELDDFLFTLPPTPEGSDAYFDAGAESTKEFGQACLTHTGELLGFVDTNSAARDLDLLRAVLGDKKLNYLGYSYGTLLGATYAELYPGNTGRLVLDGALDPATTDFDVTATQAQGFESALRAYLDWCLAGKDCPFSGTTNAAAQRVRALLDGANEAPLTATDGRLLGEGSLFTGIALPLYSADNWPYLSDLFTSVFAGDADYAFQLADNYYSRDSDGKYLDNSTEAFTAINCLDYKTNASRDQLRSEAAELARIAPVFGPSMSYGGALCADWPFPSTRERTAIVAAGSAPILVVGTTNDPATPYRWAQALAASLENGTLVTYNGEGHTAYNKSNSCVNDAVDDFLVDGTVPAADPNC